MNIPAVPAVAGVVWQLAIAEAVVLIALLVVRELLRSTGRESRAARNAWAVVLVPLLLIFVAAATARIIYVT